MPAHDLDVAPQGDIATETVALRNTSAFPLTFRLAPADAPPPNFSNQLPFSFLPPEAEIMPGQTVQVGHLSAPRPRRSCSKCPFLYPTGLLYPTLPFATPEPRPTRALRIPVAFAFPFDPFRVPLSTQPLLSPPGSLASCLTPRLQVRVSFQPDFERTWPFRQRVQVDVPNLAEAHFLALSGRCSARQMYLVPSQGPDGLVARPDVPEAREDPLLPHPSFSSAGGSGAPGAAGFGERPAETPTVRLTFQRGHPGPLSVNVGCAAVSEAMKSGATGGTFELEWDPANVYFAASMSKGSVVPGAVVPVAFTFTPPAVEETYGLDVGQWARTTVKVHLSGGFSHPHAYSGPVVVLLEGFISV